MCSRIEHIIQYIIEIQRFYIQLPILFFKMDSKKPSGSEFKKRRIQKQAEALRNTQNISTFFTKEKGLSIFFILNFIQP